jgi:translocator protein
MAAVIPTRSLSWKPLLAWLALCYGAAVIGGFGSANARDFYLQLDRPAWSPPGWLFGPVWLLLYTLMAVAAWRVSQRGDAPLRRAALAVFGVKLALNALWSWLFFAWQSGLWAFWGALLLALAVAASSLLFRLVDRTAAVMMLPYLAWTSFATLLSWTMWQRNPALLG